MPERKENEDIGSDELLDRLVSDPANPDVNRITGFLMGKSNREGYWRLYMSVDLNYYLEFRKEDTLHAQQFRPSRTVVWLKKGAIVHRTNLASAPLEFLQGEIRRGFLRGIGFSGGPHFVMLDDSCPGSGCAHCTVACSNLPGNDTVGYTCGC